MSGVLRFELTGFQFNHHIAAEIEVVKQQVDIEIITAYIQVIFR